MDSNMSKQALYEILSACRLCGSNAGYKMPIVQNIIAVDGILLELPQKIKDCVNIEVKLNEKMPPLICEPCVVKVNNFHNFRQLCKKTNESTRLKLGLPLQATPEDAIENDGILVEKEQSLRNNSDDEPAGRNKKLKKAKTENKEPEVSVKIEKDAPPQKPKSDLSTSENARPTRRSCAASPRERTPPRMTRQKAMDNDDVALSKLLHKSPPRSTRRHTSDANDEVSLSSLKEKSPPRSTRRVASVANDEVSLSKLMEQSKKSKPPPKPDSKKEHSIKKEEPVHSLKRYSRELQQLLASPPVKKRIATNVETRTITPTQSSRTPNKPTPKPAIDPKSNDKSKSSNVSEKSNSQKRNAPNETKTPNETYPPVKETNRPQRGSNPPVKETTRPQRGLNPPVKETNRPQRGLNQPQKKSNSNLNETNPPTNETDAPGKETETVRICVVCDITFRSPRDRVNHMRRHHVTYTQSNKACNACREWFVSSVDAQKHHAQHRDKEIPYRCMLCSTDFTTNDAYELHITRHECRVSTEVPDVKCGRCWKYFPTVPLLDDHKCWGEGDRPAMCIICKETVSARNLKKHEKVCTPKKGVLDSALVEQDILDRLKPMQVRVARCDPLLKISEQGHFNVATVRNPYGLDRHFFYPYVSATPKIKTGPITSFNSMFKVNDDAKTEFDYVHWDSDSNDSRTLSSLKSLCLKVIYSHKLLGKVPKRLRDNESTYDNIDFNINIDSLIDHLNDIDEKLKESKNIKDPESGDKRPYLSPWNNSEDYNSDSIVTDVFRGFDLNKDQSDDSQSLMTDTVTVLLKSNKTEESVVIGESKRKEFNRSNDDMTKVSQINTEIEQRTTKLEADSSSNNINSLSVNDCISNDFKPYNTETKNTDEIQKRSEVTQGRFVKDLGEGVVNDIEHLEENDKHSANDKQDNKSEDITKVLESNENSPTESNIITLEINKDNNLLYSEKYKEGKSSTSCSDDCNSSEDILKTANEDGRTSKDLISHCEGIKDVENNDIVHEDLDINEHVDRNDNGHFNQSEVNKSDVNCETKDTSELIRDNVKENDENVSVVKDSANYSTVHSGGEFVSDSIESASSNKDVSDSKDIFKMLNERIALLNQKQVSNSSLEANIREFSNNDFRTNNSTVSSEVSQSYVNKDKVKHVNDKIHHDIDKVHHQNDNVYYNKDNLNEKGKTGDDRVEKEKDLEDLIKLRDAGLDGMDLDNVSDDDFNFD